MQLLGLYAATKVKVAIENFHATFTYSFIALLTILTGTTRHRNFTQIRELPLPESRRFALILAQDSTSCKTVVLNQSLLKISTQEIHSKTRCFLYAVSQLKCC